MGLLTDLREFLLKVRERKISLLPDPSFVDLSPLRQRLFDAARSTDTWPEKHLLLASGEALIVELAIELQSELNITDVGRLASLLPRALDHVLSEHLGVEVDGSSHEVEAAEEMLLGWACHNAFRTWVDRNEERSPMAPHYASELAMVRAGRGRIELLAAGEIFLRLSGPDATRWVLALEFVASLDPHDRWRGHPTLAKRLLEQRTLVFYDHEYIGSYGLPEPWNNPALSRWGALGILRRDKFRDEVDHGERVAFREALRRDSQHEPYILSIDAPVIERLIDAPDRVTILSQLHLDATMDPASK